MEDWASLEGIIREGLPEEAVFEQIPQGSTGVNPKKNSKQRGQYSRHSEHAKALWQKHV